MLKWCKIVEGWDGWKFQGGLLIQAGSYVDKMVKPDWSNFPRHIERDLDNGLLLQQFVLGTCMIMQFLD